MTNSDFDIIIVGGGHAGVEATVVASRMKANVALVTMDKARLGLMSCNPAIGGLGKSQLVREVDALGGLIGRAADRAGIQYRRLNMSKGPAVRATRIQCDRRVYCGFVSQTIADLPGVTIIEDEAAGLIIESGHVKGVKLKNQEAVRAGAVILATGTFLGGLIHIGDKQISSGRRGESAAIGMTQSLIEAGFETSRLKTGTPPRIDGATIDYDKTYRQTGDDPPPLFSHFASGEEGYKNEASCFLTYTTEATAQLIRDNIDRAPLFSGQIAGTGPRYCPSIEDKVTRFADKPQHQIFIEPEGMGTGEIYLNGFSTSLPEDIQIEAVRTIIGLENAKISQPGYAIEYDFVPPHQIKASLESKPVKGLFMAGQINGTSGYEEAAAQGLVAGLNAVLFLRNEPPFVPRRDEGYIGVMLDDLVTRNITEPYRMFTSRAEYRLALREDNALERMASYGEKYGLYSESELAILSERRANLQELGTYLEKTRVNSQIVKDKYGLTTKKGSFTLADLIRRPDFDSNEIPNLDHNRLLETTDLLDQAAIKIKYSGYLERQQVEISRNKKNESLTIPDKIDFKAMTGLKTEAIEKLSRFRPITLGQAGRIEGVTPSDIAVLTIYLKRA